MAEYLYDAWGNHEIITSISGIAELNPIRYSSYYFDEQTKLYYLKSRYYDSQVGRFINMDALGYVDPNNIGGLNLYAYCGNNPVMRIDPDGNSWLNWVVSGLQIVAGVILVATGVGAGFGALLIASGIMGMISNAAGSQIGGGIGSMLNGWGAISTGLSLLSFGPVGWLLGGVLILFGGATMAFGANEVVAGITGTNYIQQWTGMSDEAYRWTYFGLNIASSVGSVAGRLGMRSRATQTIGSHDYLSVKGQKPYSRIIRPNKIANFNGRGNISWSRHNATHGLHTNPHWHIGLGGGKHFSNYWSMIIRLIFRV